MESLPLNGPLGTAGNPNHMSELSLQCVSNLTVAHPDCAPTKSMTRSGQTKTVLENNAFIQAVLGDGTYLGFGGPDLFGCNPAKVAE